MVRRFFLNGECNTQKSSNERVLMWFQQEFIYLQKRIFKGLANATHLDDRKTHLLTQIGIALGIEYINSSRQNGTFRLASLSRHVPRLVDRAEWC
jgi:hypothetical protein